MLRTDMGAATRQQRNVKRHRERGGNGEERRERERKLTHDKPYFVVSHAISHHMLFSITHLAR